MHGLEQAQSESNRMGAQCASKSLLSWAPGGRPFWNLPAAGKEGSQRTASEPASASLAVPLTSRAFSLARALNDAVDR